MKFLKKVIEDKEAAKDLVLLLERMLGDYDPPRGTNPLHASTLTSDYKDFCPREIALLDFYQRKEKPRYIPPPLRTTFDMGEAAHTLVREVWLGDYAVGDWKCDYCGRVEEFCKKPKGKCPECGHKVWHYKELRFHVEAYNVSGGLDLLVDFNDKKHTMVELKSMASDQFAELAAPLAEHRLRTRLYLNLIANSNSPYMDRIDTNCAKILYVCRGYGRKHPEHGFITPFKQFNVTRDDNSIKTYTNRAIELVDFRTNGVPPARICATAFTARAKACSCTKECWSSTAFTMEDEPK